MKFSYCVFIFFLFSSYTASSQNNPPDELRAAWVATVTNLDWPNSWDKGNVEAQKASFIKLIESLKEVNINTVFFQVRTECDAFYNSDYEPWSRYLTGTQGKYPGYDPLEFAIKVCHDRGVELHAWLNPYRVNVSKYDSGNYYDQKHIYKKHPDWILKYSDGKKILNPGLPQVQLFIKKVAGDIISKYDIDGIHFDDYFYSYGGTPDNLDIDTYNTYGSEYSSIGDFRRGSINKMIKNVMDTILETKPFLRFGVSPFGIYGNGMNPPGITGLNAYDVIYCDPLEWLKEGMVDYINPQLYWPTGGNQDFGKLLPWWADWAIQYNRDVYAGHGIYRLDDYPAESFFDDYLHEYKEYFNFSNNEKMLRYGGWSLEEVIRQINIVRQNRNKNAKGSVYFRANDFDRVNNLKKYIVDNAYKYKTLLPNQYWKYSSKPDKVTNIRYEQIPEGFTYRIVWDMGDTLSRYAVYNTTNFGLAAPEKLMDVSFNNYYIPKSDIVLDNLSIAIVKINRFWKTGDISSSFTIPKPDIPNLLTPDDKYASLSRSDMFTWNTANYAGKYEIEFSEDLEFNNIVDSFSINNTSLPANRLSLNGEKPYYWRVRAANIAGYSGYSSIRKVTTGFPKTPNITYPTSDEKNIPLDLTVEFDVSDKADSVHLQISKINNKFDPVNIKIDTVISRGNGFTLQKTLGKYSVYFIRIKAKNHLGYSNWSEVVKFRTLMPVPDKTEIIQPKNNSGLDENSDKIEFLWNNATNASYYKFQISEKEDFSILIKDDNVYTGLKYIYHNPPVKKWMYARVAGKNIGGLGTWSDPVHFVLDNSVDVQDLRGKSRDIYVFPNPSEDNFSIIIGQKSMDISIGIFDSTGKKLFTESVATYQNNEVLSFDIKQFICQPCFIRVTTQEFTKTIKLIKK